MAAPTPKQDTFDLLGLPKELRFQFYEYLLRPEIVGVYSYSKQSAKGRSINETARRSFHAKVLDKNTYPLLLSTCSFIHAEARGILYSPHTLRLQPAHAIAQIGVRNSNDRKIDARQLHKIRRLHSLELDITIIDGLRPGDIKQSKTLAYCLNPKLQVELLFLKIKDDFRYVTDHTIEYRTHNMSYSLLALPDLFHVWFGVLKAPCLHMAIYEPYINPTDYRAIASLVYGKRSGSGEMVSERLQDEKKQQCWKFIEVVKKIYSAQQGQASSDPAELQREM